MNPTREMSGNPFGIFAHGPTPACCTTAVYHLENVCYQDGRNGNVCLKLCYWHRCPISDDVTSKEEKFIKEALFGFIAELSLLMN